MHIVEHLPVEELEQRYRAADGATQARHIQAIWMLAQERTVLDEPAFAPRWVEQLATRYNARGPEALGDQRRHNGRAASVLTEAVLAALAEQLRALLEDGGRWTGAKVALWMTAQLGVERIYSGNKQACARRGWKTLKQVHWSIQAPRSSNGLSSRGARRGGGTCQGRATRHPGRGLGRGRVLPWTEADPPARVGTDRRAAYSAGPSPLPVAARDRFCAADLGRGSLVPVQRPEQVLVREAAGQLRTADRSRPRTAHRPCAEQPRRFRAAEIAWGGMDPKGLTVPEGIMLVFLRPYSPELQPVERLWSLVDEPVANKYFASRPWPTPTPSSPALLQACLRRYQARHLFSLVTQVGPTKLINRKCTSNVALRFRDILLSDAECSVPNRQA
jgi:hypothetical protein